MAIETYNSFYIIEIYGHDKFNWAVDLQIQIAQIAVL